MRELTVAATQMACDWDIPGNIARAEKLVREAAGRGARLILLQELFETPYFCQDQLYEFLALARPADDNPLIAHFSALARELGVVLPLSFFERAGQAAFNSLAVIDADGSVLGIYRKSHIPDGPGYTEKFYFSPGDTGFRVWDTAVGRVGIGICWDQWFPECARAMALMGAEILLYPTAIGSEPHDAELDSAAHWQRVMQGHAGANLMPLLASNRIGTEPGRAATSLTFYGSSFIAGPTGEKVAEAGQEEAVLTASFDLDAIARQRQSWGVFRDRRPELYTPLLSLDGRHAHAGIGSR
ncbi:N-carbamoylputrescine amidase [Ancylobacter sp. 6x-1]|uniref:N-carbamoylputrescine amidase n=1 Tax=Ancylobacter crimeensis TaxID=2579147 RepID=A0ABT0DBE9_9HYPH|nr:N-carbamoylputrescine amidase [Ancylobacter crimeensis]MCK0197279.1 N-carbamoylputrescine amidase [Ancylobacter crimeensis]